ncbi:hypothetical protein ABWI01_03365 [Oceanicaulis alexandrii]|uniref:hypothetical protein n=1 Tax=Oceanicaulis alexandrii TaxID=153233 RepID=UPI0035D12B41
MALFNDEQRAAMEVGGNRFALLFRLATPSPVRIWSGPGELPVPSDPTVETVDGALYQGLGALPDLPTLESLFNGTASRIDLSLSAPDENGDLAALADSEAVSARERKAVFGIWPLDKDWQPVGPVRWIWRGVSHGTSVNQDGSDPARPTSTVSISIGSRFTGRRQAKALFWTPTDQALDAPGDRGFDNVAALSEGVEKKWPKA